MATRCSTAHIVLIMISIASFISSVDALPFDGACKCDICGGEDKIFCWKDKVQCASGKNDNPLINDVDRVMKEYIKVYGPGGKESEGFYVKEGSDTVFVVEMWVIHGTEDEEIDICMDVCQQLHDCVAVEYQMQPSDEDDKYMECSYAYACNSTLPWHPDDESYKHGIWIDTVYPDDKNSAEEEQDYVPYQKAKAQSDNKDVALSSASTCGCDTCGGSDKTYCWKDKVQCTWGKEDDNPLIHDVDRVLKEYIKVYGPGDEERKGIYVKEGSDTVFVVETWVIDGTDDTDICMAVCEQLDECVAIEYQMRPSDFNAKYIECSYAYSCDTFAPWDADDQSYRHGIWIDGWIDTVYSDDKKSLPAKQGNDYVPYSKAKAQSDNKEVALPSDPCNCALESCDGPEWTYCWKDSVHCQTGENDNPLINDVDKVLEAYIKVMEPSDEEKKAIYVKEGSDTIFVVENSVPCQDDVCTDVCEQLDECVAVEYQIQPSNEDDKYMYCSYAYACDTFAPWHPEDKSYRHGIWIDNPDDKKSLPVQQGNDYVPYSEANAHLDIEDVALTADYVFLFAGAFVAFLFLGIGICLGLAIKKYPKQVQYPQQL